MAEPDHYAALKVHPDATDAEIKRRYRSLMRSVHPDANAADPHANRKAAALNRAFEVIGDPERRRAYDDARGRKSVRKYEAWAEHEDWEDVVAESVPGARPAHVHSPVPSISPDEIAVDMLELEQRPRVRRSVTITNPCACTLRGDVSTSEPWVWGPVGEITVPAGQSVTFDIEVIARKVTFPGLSRVVFVARDWSGVVPVKVNGFRVKARRVVPATSAAYVPGRRRRAVRR
ncbi:MAG: DnaJ domain-containing protein [Chloroflexi bacterium]|nr:DnaJ domain-containing protein [Chloroflexota bacterium]